MVVEAASTSAMVPTSPVQLANWKRLAGLAVSVTWAPDSCSAWEGETEPAPEGLTLTLSVYVGVGLVAMSTTTMTNIIHATMIPAEFFLLIVSSFCNGDC